MGHGGEGMALALLGAMLLAGYFAYVGGALIHVPRVTILLVIGALSGPSGLDLIPHRVSDWFPFIAQLALAMVGFLLGESFAGRDLKRYGPRVVAVSIGEAVGAAVAVFGACWLAGASLPLALVIAGVAPASAPAALLETLREGGARGPLTRTVLGIVAIDDAWGVILFSVLLVAATGVAEGQFGWMPLARGLWEVGGAVLLGGLLAFPMAWVTGRVRGGEPTLIEAGGFVLLCAGVAGLIGTSYLLATMTLGAVLANRGAEQVQPFHAVQRVSEPFFAVFFLLAGFRFDLGALTGLGLIGAAYVVARAVGLIGGGWLSARWVGLPAVVQKRVGFCLLPQAGVALGLGLLAKERLPSVGDAVLSLVIGTTALFEVVGPLVARRQLSRAGELHGETQPAPQRDGGEA